MARVANRLRALAGAVTDAVSRQRLAGRPPKPNKILVLHELLLGDTVMLAGLLAALRWKYPHAELFVSSPPAYASVFSGKPYGAHVLRYSERSPGALEALEPARDADLVVLPGDNRHAIAARAIGARWVAGFAGGKPAWRNRAVDEFVDFPFEPAALGDLFMLLAAPGEAGLSHLRYRREDWPAPDFAPFEIPAAPYAVLHVGAGSPLRLWPTEKWREIADELSRRGLEVAWSAGPGEEPLVEAIDPRHRHASYAGKLDLAQLWHLLSGARTAVTLDTGIAHMAKLTGTPVAALFGPGSAQLFGAGTFWRDQPFEEVTLRNFACRDQRHLFKREVEWVRRCNRKPPECPRARCMEGIAIEQVLSSLQVK